MLIKPVRLFAFQIHTIRSFFAFLYPVPIEIAGRFAFAEGLALRLVAGQRVRIIELVSVAIRLVERQCKRVTIGFLKQLIVKCIVNDFRLRRRCGNLFRHFVCACIVFKPVQPVSIVVVRFRAEMPEKPKPCGECHAAHRQNQYDGKHECRRNLSLHNRLFSLNDAVEHLSLFPLRDIQAGEVFVKALLDVFIPVHALLLLPSRREEVHTPF